MLVRCSKLRYWAENNWRLVRQNRRQAGCWTICAQTVLQNVAMPQTAAHLSAPHWDQSGRGISQALTLAGHDCRS